jgi:uroporphyrin-III C-methyltransferase / precorrin-2 dehydrogenase / sirohydrochlorin ferrochelatase
MEYLPVFLDINGKKCVIVGGGSVAFRKATLLARAGARIHLVSKSVSPALQQLLKPGAHNIRVGEFVGSDLDDASLVVAATDSRTTNETVSEYARIRNIPVNVVDEPELCSFIFPAVIERGAVSIAISSSGTSPILTRSIKEKFESQLPERTSDLADLLGSFRQRIKTLISNSRARLRFWERILDSEVPELVYSGKQEQARSAIDGMLRNHDSQSMQGEVYLVGAGPGDPDLLTLRALRLMQKADVVLFDRLVSQEILLKLRADAEKIHVGKARSKHAVEQEQINAMLVRLALEGKRVLRLKGGDPFIFGRGGEEIESLIQHHIPFQVVPGITAAAGCASYAGIPLTHRDHAHSVQFLTGHFSDSQSEPNWKNLLDSKQTLVFYMGLLNLASICAKLIEHGRESTTPVALIQQGTTRTQKVFTGTLLSLPEIVAAQEVRAPTLIIVGGVVSLREKLAWFSSGSRQG